MFRFDGITVSEDVSSNHAHSHTSLARSQNSPVAVGSWAPNNKKVEEMDGGEWIERAHFPFVFIDIYAYSMATLTESLYLFGKFWEYLFRKRKMVGTALFLPLIRAYMRVKKIVGGQVRKP